MTCRHEIERERGHRAVQILRKCVSPRYAARSISLFAASTVVICLFYATLPRLSYRYLIMKEYRIWPNNDTDKTMNRLVEQTQYMHQIAQQHINSAYSGIQMNEGKTNSSTPLRGMKIILRLGKFNLEEWIEGQQKFLNDRCPITNCWLTSNYAKYHKTANVLLITELKPSQLRHYLPKPAGQIWIAEHREAPVRNYWLSVDVLRNLVNWTATYRRDSTIPIPYGFLQPTAEVDRTLEAIPKSPAADLTDVNYADGKTKHVAWFISNCRDTNGRNRYVHELAKFIPIDTFGKCGTSRCPKHHASCTDMLRLKYKFYLAFENSNCRDYITEKIFDNAYRNNVLPIVMGAHPDDYSAVLPPHSYIHVDEFRSPRKLAEYLLFLETNDTLYNEYFRWKSSWTQWPYSAVTIWCRMCALLHAADSTPPYIAWHTDYARWWNTGCNGAPWVPGKRWRSWTIYEHPIDNDNTFDAKIRRHEQ